MIGVTDARHYTFSVHIFSRKTRQEIFERGQCPAASLLPARHYDTLENDERGREERETAGYGLHRDPSSGSVVRSASARRVSVGQPDRHTVSRKQPPSIAHLTTKDGE